MMRPGLGRIARPLPRQSTDGTRGRWRRSPARGGAGGGVGRAVAEMAPVAAARSAVTGAPPLCWTALRAADTHLGEPAQVTDRPAPTRGDRTRARQVGGV
jgi:hypothetical protein